MKNRPKYIIVLCVLLSIVSSLYAQKQTNTQEKPSLDCFNNIPKFEIGITAGASYYTGDFNPNFTPLYKPLFFGGIMVRQRMADYFSIRGNVLLGHVKGDAHDMEGFPPDPWNNNWLFQRPWIGLEAMAEFNFMPYDAVDLRKKKRFTPLLMLGVGATYLFPDVHTSMSKVEKPNEPIWIFDIPVGIGIKWCIAKRFTLGAEWIHHVSFTDKIDFYNGVNAEHSPIINNDWIGTIGLSLSYLLKIERPCPANYQYTPSTRYYKGSITGERDIKDKKRDKAKDKKQDKTKDKTKDKNKTK
jgi:hypothetical protein